jgi:hypothetical protein
MLRTYASGDSVYAANSSREVPRVKKAPLLGCVPGIGAVADAVAVEIEVAAEPLHLLQRLGVEHLATVVAARVVPAERLAHVVVHAELEVAHDQHRGLQPVGQIERVGSRSRSTP